MPRHRHTLVVLLTLVILSGGLGAFLVMRAETPAQELVAFVCISLAASICSFGFLKAVARVKRPGVQLAGAFAGFVVVLVLMCNFAKTDLQDVRFTVFVDDHIAPAGTMVRLAGQVSLTATDKLLDASNGTVNFRVAEPSPEVAIEVTVPSYLPKLFSIPTGKKYYRLMIKSTDLNKIPVTPAIDPPYVPEPTGFLNGYVVPPKLEFSITTPTPPELIARCGKNSPSRLLSYSTDWQLQQTNATNYRSIIDPTRIIREETFPYGWYHATLALTDHVTQQTKFNYIYCLSAHKDPVEAFGGAKIATVDVGVQRLTTAENEVDGANMLLIDTTTRDIRANFYQTLIKQRFDFKRNFAVEGAFTLRQTKGNQFAVELGFGNGYADMVSVIFNDGNASRYSIKVPNDKALTDETSSRNAQYAVNLDGRSRTYFEIRFLEVAGNTNALLCKVYASNKPVIVADDQDIQFKRPISAHYFVRGDTRIRLKIWGNGEAAFPALSVGAIK